MKNLKVSMKLITGFSIVIVLSVIIGSVGIYGLTSMGNAADIMYTQKAYPLGDLADAMQTFQRCRVIARDTILFIEDTEKITALKNEAYDRVMQFESAMNSFNSTIQTENGKRLYADIMNNFSIFSSLLKQLINDAVNRQSQDSLIATMLSAKTSTDLVESELSELIDARMEVMETANRENFELQQTLLTIIIVVIILCACISLLLALYISGMISRPLVLLATFMHNASETGDIELKQSDIDNISKTLSLKDEISETIGACASFVSRQHEVSKVLEKIADGDLTVGITLLSEKDTMGGSLQKMTKGLNSMFNEIKVSTNNVSSGSKQIADGSQELAQGSAEQASAVEQLSSTISDIAQKTKENAMIARKAAELSGVIKNNAEKGSAQMDSMTQAVKEINEASSQISKVIKVIDDIAFQTNILALNAAVEAARAGQHGKGFAVVAEEVRNLAAKSAEAAKDTGILIENSIEKANYGLFITGETSASLKEIVEGINNSALIVTQIAESSDEQAEAIKQINTGIDQVAQVVQQNSATAEESAAASEEMNGQSNMLEQLLSQFKITAKENGQPQTPKAAATPKSTPAKQLMISNSLSINTGKY